MIKPKKTLENVSPYQTDKYKIDWRLKLDSNENIYSISPIVVNAIKNMDFSEVSLYPAYGKTIDKLSEKYNVKYENILLTNGCDEAINVIINAYLDKEDEILSYNPTFVMPQKYAEILGAKVNLIDYDEKFIFKTDKIEKNISDKTKIIYISTPNNPTGELVKASVVEVLVKKYPEILFLVDCTYINFSYNSMFMDYVDLACKYDNVVVVKSFSKDFALAGLRFGFAVGAFDIINNLKKVISPYSVNVVALNCAIAVLNDEKTFEEIKEQNYAAKNALIEGLRKNNIRAYDSEANFVFCDFGDYCDFYYQKLKKHGVIVRNFSKNSEFASFLRITVPKIGGVKFILELLNKKDILIMNLDGTVFDVSNSYMEAIAQSVKYFSGREISLKEIMEIKNHGSLNCNIETIKALLNAYEKDADYLEITAIFKQLLFDKNGERLIDKEKILISKENLAKLAEKYDLVVFSGRTRDEIEYSLNKFDIAKYFYYIISSDDLPKNALKPSPRGVFDILKHCPYLSVKYLGSSVDDIIASNNAEVETVGVISPYADNNLMINNFRHLGVNYILNDAKNIVTFLEDIEKLTV